MTDMEKPRVGGNLAREENMSCMIMEGIILQATHHNEQSQLLLMQYCLSWEATCHQENKAPRSLQVKPLEILDYLLVIAIN